MLAASSVYEKLFLEPPVGEIEYLYWLMDYVEPRQILSMPLTFVEKKYTALLVLLKAGVFNTEVMIKHNGNIGVYLGVLRKRLEDFGIYPDSFAELSPWMHLLVSRKIEKEENYFRQRPCLL